MADLVATANKELGCGVLIDALKSLVKLCGVTYILLVCRSPVQILINNASALWWKSIEETPIKRYDLINSINSRGTFAMTAACLPTMREYVPVPARGIALSHTGTALHRSLTTLCIPCRCGWGHVITQSPPIELDNMKDMTA